ncbi:MAG: hypothetical protein JNL34_15605 [Anaerolineae bacterium]|nr:hypothetical protein [Anaerolineae bacterium]
MTTRRDRALLGAAFALGIGWLLVMLARSPGVLLDDEITHALISINAWRYPEALLDVWGRPGNTIAYMLPALLGGLEGRRLFAIVLCAVTAGIAVIMAGRFSVKAGWLVVLCFFFQPWIAKTGFQSVTQIPFSLALAAGVLAWMTGRWGLAGLCFGLLPLIRHEGIALAGAWVLFALVRRQWWSALLAILPLGLYNALYYLLFGRLASGNLLDSVPTTEYGSGSWLHFVPLLTAGVGIPVLVLALTGLLPAARQRDETRRVPWGWSLFYLAPYGLYFLVHTLLFHFGLFASGGYGVFLLPLAPAAAVLAARGGEWAFAGIRNVFNQRLPAQAARWGALGLASVALVFIFGAGLSAAPTPLDPLHEAQQQAAMWVQGYLDTLSLDPPVAAAHVAFWLAFHPAWPESAEPWWFDEGALPVGSLLVWDSKYSPERGMTPASLARGGWREMARFGSEGDGSAAIIYQREAR